MALSDRQKRKRNARYQARWREKRNALAREAMAKTKTRGRRGRRARPVDAANAFISELLDFWADFENRLNAWRELERGSEEDQEALTDALHGVANVLSILALRIAGIHDVGRPSVRPDEKLHLH